jgi:hypothetical protein
MVLIGGDGKQGGRIAFLRLCFIGKYKILIISKSSNYENN